MDNCFVDITEIKKQTVSAIMGEFDRLINAADTSVNYWLDSAHNIFGIINDDGRNSWIEIHYELYDSNEEIIGDIWAADTNEVNRDELLREITAIVDNYYK